MTPGAKVFVAIVLALVMIGAGLGFNIVNQQKLIDIAEQNRQLNIANKEVLKVVLAVTDCTTKDTPTECKVRQQKKQLKAFEQLECRQRSIIEGDNSETTNQRCKPPDNEEGR